MDKKKQKRAKAVYDMICDALYEKNIKALVSESDKIVFVSVEADIPVKIMTTIDEERQIIRMIATLPFRFPEDKRVDGAIAACTTNFFMKEGGFDFDCEEGGILFRLCSTFADSDISPEVYLLMLAYAFQTVDFYDNKFYGLASGQITLQDFLDIFKNAY